VGEVLADGAIVVGEGLTARLVLRAEPLECLQRVRRLVVDEAERWEADHTEEEAANVRDRAVELGRIAGSLARECDAEIASIYRRLLAAATEPLSPTTQAGMEDAERELAALTRGREDDEVVSESASQLIEAGRALVIAKTSAERKRRRRNSGHESTTGPHTSAKKTTRHHRRRRH
jgi:hypothetical protein